MSRAVVAPIRAAVPAVAVVAVVAVVAALLASQAAAVPILAAEVAVAALLANQAVAVPIHALAMDAAVPANRVAVAKLLLVAPRLVAAAAVQVSWTRSKHAWLAAVAAVQLRAVAAPQLANQAVVARSR